MLAIWGHYWHSGFSLTLFNYFVKKTVHILKEKTGNILSVIYTNPTKAPNQQWTDPTNKPQSSIVA